MQHQRLDVGRCTATVAIELGSLVYSLYSRQVAIDLDHFSGVVDHVQHQSAAAVAPTTDRQPPPATSPAVQRPSATLLPQATDQMIRTPDALPPPSAGWTNTCRAPARSSRVLVIIVSICSSVMFRGVPAALGLPSAPC